MSVDGPARPLTAADAAPDVEDALLLESSGFVTVPALVSALRRRWRLWAATSVAGLLTALAFSLVSPPAYTATTTLLLRHPANVNPSRAILTDAQLIKTRALAQTTLDKLALPLSAKEFVSQYSVNALSDELLSMTVSAPTSGEAVRRAEALADVFLDFRRDEVERDARLAVDTLEKRAETLTSELVTVNERINNFPPGTDGNSDAAARRLGELLTRRAAINEELGGLTAQIEAIIREADSVIDRSRVVDPATEDDRSPVLALLANLAAGLVGGLSLGAGWVVVQEVAFERVRRRADVAAALQAPVAMSVGSLPGPLWVQRRRFRKQRGAPEGDVAKMVGHLRASLSSNGQVEQGLAVVSVDSNGPAALAVSLAAVELANEGKSVLVADLSSDSALAALFGVSTTKASTLRHEAPSTLTLAFPLRGSQDRLDEELRELGVERRDQHDVVLALATLHPDVGAHYLSDWATRAVAVVTCGRSTFASLRSASQLLRTAGIEIASTILVAADPHDDTLGTAPTPLPLVPELPLLSTGGADEPIKSEGEDGPLASLPVEGERARPKWAENAENELRRNLQQLADEYEEFKERVHAQQLELERDLEERRQSRDELRAEVERLQVERTAAADNGDATRRERARLTEATSEAGEELERVQAQVELLHGEIQRLEIERAERQRDLDEQKQAASDRLAREMADSEAQEVERKAAMAAESHARDRVLDEIERLETRQFQLRQDVASGSQVRGELAAEVERLETRRAEAEGAEQALGQAKQQLERDIRQLTDEHQRLVETIQAHQTEAQQALAEKGKIRDRLVAEVDHLEEERQRVTQWLELQWAQAERAIAHHVHTKESLEAEIGRLRNEVAQLGRPSVTSTGEDDGSNGNADVHERME